MSGSFDVEALLAEEEAKAVAANARRARQPSGSNARADGGRLSYSIRDKPDFDRSSHDRGDRADGGRLSFSSRDRRSRDRDGDEAMLDSPTDNKHAHIGAREKSDHYGGVYVDTKPDPSYRDRLQSNDLLDNKRHVLGEGRLSSVKDEFEDSHSKSRKDEDEGRLRNDDRPRERRSETRHSSASRDVRSDRYRGDGYYPGNRRRSRSPGDSYRPSRDGRDDRDRRSRDDRDRRDDRDYRDRRDDRDHYRGGRRDRYDDRDRERHGRRREDRRNTSSSPRRPKTPEPTEDERDRRTVFVQQLAARLRSRDLIAFFEKVGPVKEAQIVKDRVSGRSKG